MYLVCSMGVWSFQSLKLVFKWCQIEVLNTLVKALQLVITENSDGAVHSLLQFLLMNCFQGSLD